MKINFLIISSKFRHYFLKGFLSGLAAIILVKVSMLIDCTKAGEPASRYYFIILFAMLLYWILITVGYIYGYMNNRKKLRLKQKTGLICKKCHKENDNDAKHCIYCGEKIK